MWRKLVEHVAGAYSEHAKTKRYTQRRGAWGDAHRAAGKHCANDTSRKRHHAPHGAAASASDERTAGVRVRGRGRERCFCDLLIAGL
jgi:hypothetical protein